MSQNPKKMYGYNREMYLQQQLQPVLIYGPHTGFL